MNRDKFYKKAKRIISDKTPLKKDCGLLCGAACCKGDENTGMLLFPGEKTALKVTEKDGVRLAVCEGKCNRKERPLACMIFPFIPYIDEKGRIKTIPDIRGSEVCPVVRNTSDVKLHRGFLMRVKRLGRFLIRDEECEEFLRQLSRETDMLLKLYGKERLQK